MTSAIQDCIWCKRPVRKANVEHILPDSLGCPPDFVLRGCVCMACNNGLGHVDQALLRQFEIIAFMHGVRRKGGRPPVINNWAAIRGHYGATGPEIFINAGPQTVEALGKNLHAASSRNGIHAVTNDDSRIVGQESQISFKQEFGREPKLRRAIYKVAFGTLAFHLGAAEALRDAYDPVRAFVRKGQGDFDVLMMSGGEMGESHYFCQPIMPEGCTMPILDIAIFGVSFGLDLDPEQKGLAQMRERLTERQVQNWMILPRAA
ncbi:HNH endonuclease [Sphingomonas kyeonggiensis]|uniref:HNH endonuclease 5 domain-containing protein n=1 Tax=Sphingomonas kyeonggiensis TaxID=1268553 RepID=A0A7W6NWR0_9SPHN|nr:HNH endonuclease [Sphingomonas kyeonggiensis]MBB4099379.1 hypothetical protein [Sphingomonas kyeonggiensis]